MTVDSESFVLCINLDISHIVTMHISSISSVVTASPDQGIRALSLRMYKKNERPPVWLVQPCFTVDPAHVSALNSFGPGRFHICGSCLVSARSLKEPSQVLS